MTYLEWYDLVENRMAGKATSREIAGLAFNFKLEYEISKSTGATKNIRDLMKELFSEDSPEAEAWFKQLASEVNVLL